MPGQTTERPGGSAGLSLGTLDADSADRIDVHLKRALEADDEEEKDFHVRHARQLLEACTEA
jgi:hypothetical protein